jgi:hypothetical protein
LISRSKFHITASADDGIPKIYADYVSPDGSKRNSWHITGPDDNRLMEHTHIVKKPDGWYVAPPNPKGEFRLECVSDPSIVAGDSTGKPGEKLIETFYLPKVKEKGYLYKDPDSKDGYGDFGNIEVTWMFKVTDPDGQVELVPGGLRQTNDTYKVGKDGSQQVPACCEAMSYHFKLDPKEGRPRFEKDTDHKNDAPPGKKEAPVGYADHAFEKKNAVDQFVNNEVIQKAVLYRVAGQDAMKLELYFDGTGQGNELKKILEVTDNGDWGPTRGYTYIGQGGQGEQGMSWRG